MDSLNTGNIYKPHNNIIPPPNFNVFYYKHDRRYIPNYLYPVDGNEIDRIQFQHDIYSLVWGNQFSAPINESLNTDHAKILDVG